MKIIGLTGGIGAGKSYAAELFAKKGFTIIDADKISQEIYCKNGKCLAEVVAHFGRAILDGEGELDRKALAAIVFDDRQQLDALNQIAHRYIMSRIEQRLHDYQEQGVGYVLLDAPQLFEAGADQLCDYVVSVLAPTALRIERICLRDGLSKEQALERINKQYDDGFFIAHSDFIIHNDGKNDPAYQVTKICGFIMEDS